MVQGRRDTVVDPSGAELLHQRMKGSQLEWLERSNHLVSLDVEAAQLLELVCRFVATD